MIRFISREVSPVSRGRGALTVAFVAFLVAALCMAALGRAALANSAPATPKSSAVSFTGTVSAPTSSDRVATIRVQGELVVPSLPSCGNGQTALWVDVDAVDNRGALHWLKGPLPAGTHTLDFSAPVRPGIFELAVVAICPPNRTPQVLNVSDLPQFAIQGTPSGGSSFSGTITSSDRALTTTDVRVSGDLVLGPLPVCSTGVTARSYRVDVRPLEWPAFGVSQPPLYVAHAAIGPGSYFLDFTTRASPGHYELAVLIECGGRHEWSFVAGLPTFGVQGIVGHEMVTIAYTDQASLFFPGAPGVLPTEPVNFFHSAETVWTDGTVSYENPCCAPFTQSPIAWRCDRAELYSRAVGASTWSKVASGNARVTITDPGDFRYVVDGRITRSLYVRVIRPTSAHRISIPSVSPSSAVVNVPLEFAATMETQFDDQVWRPSLAGTGFELQFLADGGTAWSRLVSGKLTDAGKVQMRWPMLGSGRFRLVAGSAVSETVAVTEVKPTSVVAPDPLNLPVEVFPGEPVDISVGVDVQYSDGVYRDAPDGTPFSVEFAEAFSRTRSNGPSALVWRPVATGSTAGGRANVQVKPRTSGYWRIAFGQTRTAEVYLEVVGSQPGPPTPVTLVTYGTPSDSSISWSFTPRPGLTYRASARTASGAVPSSQIVLDSAGLVTVSGLPPATTVIVTVIGTDAYGQSDGGATAQGTTAGGSTQAAIVISGTRTQVRGKPGFVIKGTATGLNAGTTLRPMTRMPGDTGYQLGNVRITPGVDGTFTWKRTGRFKVYVYVATEDGLVASNRVIIPAA